VPLYGRDFEIAPAMTGIKHKVGSVSKAIRPFDDEEDKATLAAIDEGIRDGQAG
jgi:hypothetical protein